jgi:hypothetical protein
MRTSTLIRLSPMPRITDGNLHFVVGCHPHGAITDKQGNGCFFALRAAGDD